MAHHPINARGSKLQQIFFNFLFGVLLGSLVTHIVLRNSAQDSKVDDSVYLKVLSIAKYFATLVTSSNGASNHHAEDSDTVILGEHALSNWMSSRVRILCWILTSPENLQLKAIHLKATWTRRCNTVLFMSSENTDFPSIAVSDHEGKKYLWEKTSGAFEYIYKHYLDKADWFLKADDDTYVIVENLRKLVSLYDPAKPIIFGRKFMLKGKVEVAYMQGGAGYVMSRKAVELLVETSFKSALYYRIRKWNPGEDVMIGMLLLEAGVEDGYSRDGIHETFHAVAPGETIVPTTHPYTVHNFYPFKQGPECCSDYTISFHHVTPEMMYWLEYMVYHMRPFGVGYHACPADIRTIIDPLKVPPAGSMNATKGRNVKPYVKKEKLPKKKSIGKSTSGKKPAPRERKRVNTNKNKEKLRKRKYKGKPKPGQKRAREEVGRFKEVADIKKEDK